MNLLGFIPDVINGITGFFTKKQEIKKIAEEAKASVMVQKQTGENEIKLTDAQWEAISAQGQADSWKDEYVTIVITAPLVMLVIGSVTSVFFDDIRMLTAGIDSIKAMTAAGIDMGFMMQTVVLAAVGLKIWRKA